VLCPLVHYYRACDLHPTHQLPTLEFGAVGFVAIPGSGTPPEHSGSKTPPCHSVTVIPSMSFWGPPQCYGGAVGYTHLGRSTSLAHSRWSTCRGKARQLPGDLVWGGRRHLSRRGPCASALRRRSRGAFVVCTLPNNRPTHKSHGPCPPSLALS
jgi:hypothetical protein